MLNPDMTWAEFCDLYLAQSPPDAAQFKSAEQLFRRRCEPTLLADADEAMFTRFADALAAEDVYPRGVQRRVSNIRRALKWGFDNGLLDPSRFPVDRAGDKWIWRTRKAAA